MAFPHDGKKFEPGNKANPNGRPKKLPDLEKLLVRVLGSEEENKTGWEVIIEALQKKAAKGDVKAAELLLSRGYGKARQTVDLNHGGGVNIVFEPATHGNSTDQVHGSIQQEPQSVSDETPSGNCESRFDEVGKNLLD
jgi:hypothetical protein